MTRTRAPAARHRRDRPADLGALRRDGDDRSSPVLAVLPFNPALAFFLALGAFIYVVIYTIWLKPRTPLNIVIGGAAGSAAVLAGGAAANAWTDPGRDRPGDPALLLDADPFLGAGAGLSRGLRPGARCRCCR